MAAPSLSRQECYLIQAHSASFLKGGPLLGDAICPYIVFRVEIKWTPLVSCLFSVSLFLYTYASFPACPGMTDDQDLTLAHHTLHPGVLGYPWSELLCAQPIDITLGLVEVLGLMV